MFGQFALDVAVMDPLCSAVALGGRGDTVVDSLLCCHLGAVASHFVLCCIIVCKLYVWSTSKQAYSSSYKLLSIKSYIDAKGMIRGTNHGGLVQLLLACPKILSKLRNSCMMSI